MPAVPSSVTAPPAPGTYRFVVGSAAEAVSTIHNRLGPAARVLSVHARPRQGLGRWLGTPRFEVVAELPPPAPPEDKIAPPARPRLATLSTDMRLPAVLHRAGFSPRLIGRLEASPGWRTAVDRPLHEALADLGRELHGTFNHRPLRPLPARVAFLGAAGVGRTTALCKWLSRQIFTHASTGRVWKVEFDRPNPAPTLDVFCEALGVPLEHYAPGASVAPDGFLLADLPGLPPAGSPAARELVRFLDREHIDGRVLVLNAAYDADCLRAASARGREIGATHLVLTHLDEVTHWGRLWEFLIEGELTPLFLSTGPGLTGDIETEVIGALLRRTLPGA